LTIPTRPTESPSVFLEKSGRTKETLLSGQSKAGKKTTNMDWNHSIVLGDALQGSSFVKLRNTADNLDRENIIHHQKARLKASHVHKKKRKG